MVIIINTLVVIIVHLSHSWTKREFFLKNNIDTPAHKRSIIMQAHLDNIYDHIYNRLQRQYEMAPERRHPQTTRERTLEAIERYQTIAHDPQRGFQERKEAETRARAIEDAYQDHVMGDNEHYSPPPPPPQQNPPEVGNQRSVKRARKECMCRCKCSVKQKRKSKTKI